MSTDDHERMFRQLLAEHTGLCSKSSGRLRKGRPTPTIYFQEILLQVWLSLPSFRRASEADDVALSRGAEHGDWLETARAICRRRAEPPSAIGDAIVPRRLASDQLERSGAVVARLYACSSRPAPGETGHIGAPPATDSVREIADVIGVSESNVGV